MNNQLVAALNQLGEFLDQLDAGVQLVDGSFRYLYLNRAAATHGRRAGDELLGRTMEECYPGIEQTEMFSRLRRTLATGQADAMENAFSFPDGTEGWFEIRIYRVGECLAITSVDITRRKRIEVHLKHAQRMEAAAQLAGGIAHDFNNLLLIIRSFTELVGDSIAGKGLSAENKGASPGGQRDLEEILKAVDRASTLTGKLLSFSRHTGGNPKRFDVEEHFGTFLGTLSATLGEGIRLDAEIERAAGVIKIDPQSWEHALASLALNAKDAMNGRGRLTIRAQRTLVDDEHQDGSKKQHLPGGDYVRVTVSDDGPGIPAELIDKIFDPFFSTKGKGGSGMGLATCWGIVEQAGGTIQVQSRPGAGTQFDIYLPRRTTLASDSLAPPRSFAPLQPRTSFNILVVDDEPAIVRALAGLLEAAGHTVTSAPDAMEALELLERDHFQLVLTDVLMPGMSGVELAETLEQRGIEIPILLMSGYSPDDESLRGARRFPLLTKPFKARQLLAAVDRVLGSAARGTPSPGFVTPG